MTGLVQYIVQLARQGEGVLQLTEGLEKREQYGYWDARLKDGFHFEPVRQIARRRLDTAQTLWLLLLLARPEDVLVKASACRLLCGLLGNGFDCRHVQQRQYLELGRDAIV